MIKQHPIPFGSVLSLASLPIHWFLPELWSYGFAAILLGAVAGVYVGSALNSSSLSTLLIECAYASLCIGFALLGITVWIYFIPIAYVAHGFWDWVHHYWLHDNPIPKWYINACAVYDLVFAAGLTLIWLS